MHSVWDVHVDLPTNIVEFKSVHVTVFVNCKLR